MEEYNNRNLNILNLKGDFRQLNAWKDDISLKCKCLKGCHFLHSTLHDENELKTRRGLISRFP